jgi:hypothetical protein
MTVKDLVSKIHYNGNHPFIFVIEDRRYNYYDVVSDFILLQKEIQKIYIEGELHVLNDMDIVADDVEQVIYPSSSHYYLIKIILK